MVAGYTCLVTTAGLELSNYLVEKRQATELRVMVNECSFTGPPPSFLQSNLARWQLPEHWRYAESDKELTQA